MIRSVQHAIDVLEALARTDGTAGVTEVANRLGLSKPNAYRLLATLEARGYVRQEPVSAKYGLGVRCFELGMLAGAKLEVRETARPHVEALNETTRETVLLGVYDDGDVIYIDKAESPLPVAPKANVGTRCPGFCVSTGRVLLAYQQAAEIDRVLKRPLPRFTERTPTDRDEVEAELERTRRRGYAINRGSWREGVAGVAAPIRDYSGLVVAAIGCCVPESRFTAATSKSLARAVTNAAAAVSEAMGFHAPPSPSRALTKVGAAGGTTARGSGR